MIKSITVTNYLGESLKLELRFPEKSGFAVQDIQGLGPSKANINTTESATSDGSSFNSARLNARNIVMLLRLLDVPTIEAVRQKSYKYFPIKKQLKLKIETDTRTCEIYGYVEANEPLIFTKTETTQISIICPDPYLYSNINTIAVLSGIEQLFEFPFGNESLNTSLINFGEIITSHEQLINYTGDSEVGIVITIKAIGTATNVTIYNAVTNEAIKIDTDKLLTLTGNTIIAGDEITITTTKSNKSIYLLRDGDYINILNCLEKNPDWFKLVKGTNVFSFVADTGSNNLYVTIQNRTVYEGV